MPQNVVLLGQFTDSLTQAEQALSEFGLRPVRARDIAHLRLLAAQPQTLGVLMDATGLSTEDLDDACESAGRVVLCTPVAGPLTDHELDRLGVFDTLYLPLRRDELRQSLGFLRQAAVRDAAIAAA